MITHSVIRFAYSLTDVLAADTHARSHTTAPGAEPYLPVEEVAQRLDLPLGILLRRVEAGDVPSRREDGPDGVHFLVRLGDLGIESPAMRRHAAASPPPPPPPDQTVEPRQSAGVTRRPEPSTWSDRRSRRSWPDKVVPPPAEELAAEAQTVHGRGGSMIEVGSNEPRRDVASMTSLDPRELVAGLLDRWERTLEQRIYSEQRQRFEAELNARQNLVKQLQLELQTARAEHAAAQAEKDRRLADRDRRISDLEAGSARPAGRRGQAPPLVLQPLGGGRGGRAMAGDAVAEVKSRLDLVEVIGGYVTLHRAGRELSGLCPFHAEKTPSFTVSPERQVWYCHGCHEGGDLFKFIEQIERIDFRQALEMLADRAGVELESGPHAARGAGGSAGGRSSSTPRRRRTTSTCSGRPPPVSRGAPCSQRSRGRRGARPHVRDRLRALPVAPARTRWRGT